MTIKINEYNNCEEQAKELAQLIAQTIKDIHNQQSNVCIAVSGGKSPLGLFQKLSKEEINWERVIITLVDERFVNTEHKDSNQNLVINNLLINNATKASFIGLVQNNENIQNCVNNANLHIKKIDIAILGMGEDGHTSSIFPCCKELNFVLNPQLATQKYVITTPQTAMYERIGLSLAGILEIPNLFVSINGGNKLKIIKTALTKESTQYPISYVLNRRKDVQVFWHV